MDVDFKGKKLLILGGAYLHKKVVEAANEMGIYTIVTDNVPNAPAKLCASKAYDINVSDVENIVAMCKAEKVDAVLNVCLDFCQLFYYEICEKLQLPCYGSYEQFQTLTNKEKFKDVCRRCGIDTIPSYSEVDLENQCDDIEYPVLVKPAYSRGSRGQSVCGCFEEVLKAVEVARNISENGHVIIEKYMGGKEDFQVTYLVIDGNPIVVRTADRYLGSKVENMDRVAIALSSPSHNTDLYLSKVHEKVCSMIKHLEIKNAPVFMQGFVDGDTIRFYDPGLRFPGGDYDRVFADVTGINLMKLLIELAFNGKLLSEEHGLNDKTALLKGNIIFTLHSTIKAGIIKKITPLEEILEIAGVSYATLRHKEGEIVTFTGTVNQRVAEINIVGRDVEEVKRTLQNVMNKFKVLDENDDNMIFSRFEVENWRG